MGVYFGFNSKGSRFKVNYSVLAVSFNGSFKILFMVPFKDRLGLRSLTASSLRVPFEGTSYLRIKVNSAGFRA